MRARAGDPKAQFQLYESAPFAPGSLHWLRRAAEQGHREAQGELGWYYHTHARPRRPDLARRWWGLAAAQGDAEIQNVLGELLRDGAGVRRNYREAFRWFVAAARAGEPTAQLNAGWALYYGRGVRRDRRAALLWYRLVAARRKGATRHAEKGPGGRVRPAWPGGNKFVLPCAWMRAQVAFMESGTPCAVSAGPWRT